MKSCQAKAIIAPLLLFVGATSAFSISSAPPAKSPLTLLHAKAIPETVEVCGFKDCRRAGGGAKLENLVKTVRDSITFLPSNGFSFFLNVYIDNWFLIFACVFFLDRFSSQRD